MLVPQTNVLMHVRVWLADRIGGTMGMPVMFIVRRRMCMFRGFVLMLRLMVFR